MRVCMYDRLLATFEHRIVVANSTHTRTHTRTLEARMELKMTSGNHFYKVFENPTDICLYRYNIAVVHVHMISFVQYIVLNQVEQTQTSVWFAALFSSSFFWCYNEQMDLNF